MKLAVILLAIAAVLTGLGFDAARRSTMNVMGRPVPVDAELMAALTKAYGPGGMYSVQTNADLPALRKKHRAYKAKSIYFGLAALATLTGVSVMVYPIIRHVGARPTEKT